MANTTTEVTQATRQDRRPTRGEVGIDPASVARLGVVRGAREELAVSWEARFRAACPSWVEDHVRWADFRWADHWHYIPVELLTRVFTRDEQVRMWHDEIFESGLARHFEENDALLWKVQHALWRYGGSRDYRRFVAYYNHLADLSAGTPNFTVRITHTRFCNTAAWAIHGREDPIYLDASFGALLHYRGAHVMTVGFTPSAYGVLIAQVQLRKKTGNRFLYRLPSAHLDFAIDLVARAFPGNDLLLVTGESTVAATRRAYERTPGRLTPETAARVQAFYDQPLRGYDRTDDVVHGSSDDGRRFVRLTKKTQQG